MHFEKPKILLGLGFKVAVVVCTVNEAAAVATAVINCSSCRWHACGGDRSGESNSRSRSDTSMQASHRKAASSIHLYGFQTC